MYGEFGWHVGKEGWRDGHSNDGWNVVAFVDCMENLVGMSIRKDGGKGLSWTEYGGMFRWNNWCRCVRCYGR